MAAILKELFSRRKKNSLTKTARAGLRSTQPSRTGLAQTISSKNLGLIQHKRHRHVRITDICLQLIWNTYFDEVQTVARWYKLFGNSSIHDTKKLTDWLINLIGNDCHSINKNIDWVWYNWQALPWMFIIVDLLQSQLIFDLLTVRVSLLYPVQQLLPCEPIYSDIKKACLTNGNDGAIQYHWRRMKQSQKFESFK